MKLRIVMAQMSNEVESEFELKTRIPNLSGNYCQITCQ